MSPTEELYAIDGYIVGALGRAPMDDLFVLGETEPTALNAYTPRAAVGPRVPETSMTNYAGSLTNVSSGGTLDRLIISGIFKPSVANFTLRDSIVTGGVPPGSSPTSENLWWPMWDIRSSSNAMINVEFCEAAPSFLSHEIYALKGGNATLNRCVIRDTVDGVDAHGGGTYPSNTMKTVRVLGCLIEDLQTFTDPNQSDNITHNDGVQAKGALTLLEVTGSAIYGGRTSCILVQQQVGIYGAVILDRNWLYGHPTLGSTINTSQNSKGVIGAGGGGFTVTNNRISKAGNSPFGGTTGQCIVASSTRLAGTTTWTGNVYMEDATTVNMTNGSD